MLLFLLRYGRRRIDVLRRSGPGRPAGSPTIAVPAPGERGTWPSAAGRRGPVEAAAAPQLPRRRGAAAAAPGRRRRAEGERTKTGRQILVVQSGRGPGRGDPRGRPQTGRDYRDGDQRRISEPIAHLALRASEVGTRHPRLARARSFLDFQRSEGCA